MLFTLPESEVSPQFNEFMAFLGTKTDMTKPTQYRGDMKDGFAYYKAWQHLEFVFQVAHLIPSVDRRKPIIGNTITTIIYLENGVFDLSLIQSQVLHVYIVIQPLHGQKGPKGTQLYRVAVASKKGVPRFRPVLPLATFELDDYFREFLYHKLVNGDRLAYHCTAKVRNQTRSLVEIIHKTREGQLEYCVSKMNVASRKGSRSLKRLLTNGSLN